MKVSIITEGGKNIGFGHLTRSLSLYEEFRRRKIKVTLVVNSDGTLLEKLKGKPFKTYPLNKSSILSILANMAGDDLTVVDSYRLTRKDYLAIRAVTKFLVCLDDNRRLDYPADVVINGAVYARDLHYPPKEGREYWLGSEFIPIRAQFAGGPTKRIKEKIERVLLTFGGDDSRNMTPKIRDFVWSQFPEVTLDILVGHAFRNPGEFMQDKRPRLRYHYHLPVKPLIRFMQQADVAISAGGQTLYELACTGTPTIGICVAENQVNNLKGWQGKGFLRYCGWFHDRQLFNKLQGALRDVRDKRLRTRMSQSGQRFVDGRGAQRTVAHILEMIK